MSDYRTSTVFVPLFGAKGKPSWHIGSDDQSWRLADSPRTAAVLDFPLADIPDFRTTDVPYAPAPPPLEPIDGGPVARGLAVPWLTWATIRERPPFRERFAPGSFARTLVERDNPLCALVSHGQDMASGMKPIGRIQAWEDPAGLRFEIAFLNATYATDVAAGVRQNLYGASVRFAATSERVNRRPGRSQGNPDGIEERTITSARLVEISCVALPAYTGTSVAIAA